VVQQSETLAVFVDLNVLPEELRPTRYAPLFVLGILVLLAASLALIPLHQAAQATDGETSHLQEELGLLSQDLALVQLDLAKVRGLQLQLLAVEADLTSLNEERQAIIGDGREVSQDLSVAIFDLPPGMRLASVNGTDGGMTLGGRALSTEDVFEYVWTLRKSGRFSESRIVSLTVATAEAEGSGVTFVVEAVR
jgi:Tfp pilus assembly protein PilN